MGSEELLHAKLLGKLLKSIGMGIRLEFYFRQIALTMFKTDHKREALKSGEKKKKYASVDKGLNSAPHIS